MYVYIIMYMYEYIGLHNKNNYYIYLLVCRSTYIDK